MLEFVAIQNFKTFRSAEFELGRLNIFSGLNGMGKSTFVQSLLVLRQSYDAAVLQQGGLLLNGKLVEAWMSAISPGLRIKAEVLPALNAAGLSFQFVQGTDLTRAFKPQNVGFGLSYALPVVTAVLAAKPGELVIVENPEAHVHPAGQAQLGRLCALAAQHGVQMIVETHSDHFLNGVRVAAKGREFDAALARIHFLERLPSGDTHDTLVDSPVLHADGRLSHWPEGFFDEWDRQLRELV